jgi:hypothetical protein
MSDLVTRTRQAFTSAILSLEKRRKSRIFVLLHDFESEHLCNPDFRKLYENRNQFSGIDTLEVMIHTPGGHASIAYRMARFFRSHCKHLNFIVPIMAKSAGTLLCLAGEKIFMGELAELGPLDVQITDELERGKRPFSPLDEFKSMEFLREYATEFLDYFAFALTERGMSVKQALHESIPAVTGMMEPLYSHIDPSKVGSFRRSLAEGEDYAKRLLKQTRNPMVEKLVERLVWQYPVHDFVIDYAEGREIGLPVVKLEAAHENILVPALMGMARYGLSHTGFIEKPQATSPKATGKSRRMARRRRQRKKVPIGVKAQPQAA